VPDVEATVTSRPVVRIDSELCRLLPPLADDERAGLEDSLLTEGCRHPLVVWKETGILLDGHCRYDICTKHNIPFRVHELSLPSRDAAIVWILRNQLGRANLSEAQKTDLKEKRAALLRRQQVDGGRGNGQRLQTE
jgi:hypothetical protein